MTGELRTEFHHAVERVEQRHLDHLQALGVTGAALVQAGLVGVELIRLAGDLYEPDPDAGSPAIVVPVRDAPTVCGALVDLLAFYSGAPERWWPRLGSAPILGLEAVDLARHFDTPLSVHGSPLAWLIAECAGCVVIDPRCHLGFWLGGVDRIICDGDALAQRIGQALRQPRSPVEIRVRGAGHAA